MIRWTATVCFIPPLVLLAACAEATSSNLCLSKEQSSASGQPHAVDSRRITAAESLLALWPHAKGEGRTIDSVRAALASSLEEVLGGAAEPALIQVMVGRGPASLPALAAYGQLRLRTQPLAATLSDTSLDDRSRLNLFLALSFLESDTSRDRGQSLDSMRVGRERISFACELLGRSKLEPSNEDLLAILAVVVGRFGDERDAGSKAARTVLMDPALSDAEHQLRKRGYL